MLEGQNMPSSSSWIDGRIIDRYYTIEKNAKIKLHWILRTTEGKVALTTPAPFRPYCIIPAKYLTAVRGLPSNISIPRPKISRLENAILADSKGQAYKLEFLIPEHVGKFRRIMDSLGYPEVYQADVPFLELVMIHYDITDRIRIYADKTFEKAPDEADIPPYVIWYWDIETSDEGEGSEPDPTKERILAIAYVTDIGDEAVLAYDDEKETVQEFFDRVKASVDILVGYNSDKFDEPYFRKRASILLEISERFRGIKFLDLGPLIINAEETTLPSWSLDYIAETKLGERKLPILNGFHRTFREDRETLKARCLDDAGKLKKLEDTYKYVTFALENVALSGCPIEKAQYVSHVGDGMTLRESFHRCHPRVVWRCKHHAEKGEKFKGAIVRKPPLGIHKRVACLDFSSLYNRIIQENWISRSSLMDELDSRRQNAIDTGEGIYFSTRVPAPVPQILRRLEEDRERYVKLMQEASDPILIERYDMLQKQRKISGNAMYGFTGDARTRYYYREIADAVTRIAREYLTAVMELVQRLGYEVIYADTDGVYLRFARVAPYETMVNICQNLVPIINSRCNTLARERNVPHERRRIEIKFEAIYDPVIFFRSEVGEVAKKRYAAREMWNYKKGGFLETPKRTIVGVEWRRGDRSPLTKEMQGRIIDFLLEGDILQAIQHIRTTKKQFFAGEHDELAVLSSSLTKPEADYKSNPPHLRAARKAKAQGERLMWGKVQYVYVEAKGDKPVVEPVVRDKIPKMKSSGRRLFWEKRIMKWCKRIMGAVMNEHEFERQMSGTARLDSFFK